MKVTETQKRINKIIADINTASVGLNTEDATSIEILKDLAIELFSELDK